MSEQLQIGAQDRVLVIAPHPDDESIATGGLLQAVRAAGAAMRLLVLTDGDNNPWPQRWIEKRWHIGAVERARWGARRRTEAHAALRVLGIDAAAVRFLGLPDLGLTDRLMRADDEVTGVLRGEVDEFAPTLIVLPALSDRHPDHSAAHVLMRIALAASRGAAPRLLAFAVHGEAAAGDVAVPLDTERRRVKHDAILAHATQMQFSRGRFLAFASERENYQTASFPAAAAPLHPLRANYRSNTIGIAIDIARVGAAALRSSALFVVLETSTVSRRWLITALGVGRSNQVLNCIDRSLLPPVAVQRNEQSLELTIPLPDREALRQGYFKLARPQPGWRVFDRFGWQPLTVQAFS